MGHAEAGVAGKEDGMAALRTRRRNKVKESKGNKRRQSLPLGLLPARPSAVHPPVRPSSSSTPK